MSGLARRREATCEDLHASPGTPMAHSGEAPEGRPSRPRGGFRRLLELDPADAGLALEAALAIGLAGAALRVVSLASVVRACGVLAAAGSAPSRSAPSRPERLAWAVDAASARVGGACLVRSVALLAMLARQGLVGTLCVAFRRGPRLLPGHAWVEVDGRALGADGAAAGPPHAPAFEVLSRLVARPEAPAS